MRKIVEKNSRVRSQKLADYSKSVDIYYIISRNPSVCMYVCVPVCPGTTPRPFEQFTLYLEERSISNRWVT